MSRVVMSGRTTPRLISSRGLKLATALMLLGACDVRPDTQDVAATDGNLAGVSQAARIWQGRSLQGRAWASSPSATSAVREIRIDGQRVDGLHLEGTEIVGSIGGTVLRGADFAGATVVQTEADGTSFDSTLARIERDPADAAGETLLYTLVAVNPSTGAVENICAADSAGVAKSIPVRGTWALNGDHASSNTSFTFGCTRGVIAKCLRWGYKPWKVVSGRSLEDYHQACTRMARADYCGDGVSHTQDGTEIDLYDTLNIQGRAPLNPSSPMTFEAAWGPQGAYCIGKSRWLQLQTLTSITSGCLPRFSAALWVTSPVDSQDNCFVARADISRSSVYIDNQSGTNVAAR